MKGMVKLGLGLVGLGVVGAYAIYKRNKNTKAEKQAEAEFEIFREECDARVDDAFKRMKAAEAKYNAAKEEIMKKMKEQEAKFNKMEKESEDLEKEIQQKDKELQDAKNAFADNIIKRHKEADDYIKEVMERMQGNVETAK